MSSVIYPVTEDALSRRRYNLWGAQDNVFTRYPNAMFDGKVPSSKTNPTLDDMKRILFDIGDNEKLVVADLEVGAKIATPLQMQGIFTTDGIGNINTKTLDYNKKDLNDTYPRRLVSLSDPMELMATWDAVTRTMSLSRDNLELNANDYATHVILSIMMESPNIGMWIAFSLDNKTFYKLQTNIYNVQTKRYMEGQTICLPLILKPDMSWNETLYVQHRSMGRYILQLRGVMYRRITL